MRPLRHNTGFSLMEVVVVVAVFSIIALVATNIFLLVTQAQRRNTISQKIQGDVRFAVEAIAREARFGTIDYSCYDGSAKCDPEVDVFINLSTTRGETDVLAVRDTEGNRIRYSVFPDTDGRQKLHICFLETGNDPVDKCDYDTDADWRDDWEVITPEGVEIVRGTFHLYPFDNPFQLGGTPYLADDQPQVTVVLRTRQQETSATPQDISLQTTVTSRIYAR